LSGRPREPLGFRSIFKERVWGGRRLAEVLGKDLPGPGPFGECWEISDCGDDLSVVEGGPWDGWTLRSLLGAHPEAVLGRPGSRFPLLFKTIDASMALSVQVHPGERDEALGVPGVRSKTEAWVILDAPPDGRIVYGLTEGADREAFFDLAAAGDAGGLEKLLAWKGVRPGDVVFIPAGTIHAIGEGILLLEIQENSDTTYRIHDWGRAGLDGRPRALHLEEARAVRARPSGIPCPYGSLRGLGDGLSPLVDCPPFRIQALRIDRAGASFRIGTEGGFGVLGGVWGRSEVRSLDGGPPREVGRGGFLLIPAAAGGIEVRAQVGPFTGIWVREGPGDG